MEEFFLLEMLGMRAYEISKRNEIDIAKDLDFIQVPHHGSRGHVGPSVLNYLIEGLDQTKKNL